MLDLDKVTRATFEPCVGETFRLIATDGTLPLTLTSAMPLGSAAPGAKRDPFALNFTMSAKIRLPQAIYRLESDQLGPIELFLVQTSPTDVEAIFS